MSANVEEPRDGFDEEVLRLYHKMKNSTIGVSAKSNGYFVGDGIC